MNVTGPTQLLVERSTARQTLTTLKDAACLMLVDCLVTGSGDCILSGPHELKRLSWAMFDCKVVQLGLTRLSLVNFDLIIIKSSIATSSFIFGKLLQRKWL